MLCCPMGYHGDHLLSPYCKAATIYGALTVCKALKVFMEDTAVTQQGPAAEAWKESSDTMALFEERAEFCCQGRPARRQEVGV